MASTKGKSRLKRVQDGIAESVDTIDEQITEYEKYLKPYETIKGEIDKLRRARSALLGGNKLTGSGTTRLRQQDIVEYLTEHNGATPGQIAEKFGVKQPTVSSALYRGKGERFLTDENGHWWLRQPKVGINTYQDIVDLEKEN